MHALHRLRQRRVGLEREAGREAGRPQHAQRVVAEGDLGVERRAQAAGGQVAQPVERVDQLHVGQPERQRIDGEVPARQVHHEVVAEGDLGLAGVGHVDLGPVGRDLVDLGALAAADGAEARALGPDVVGPAPHQALDLRRQGVGGQVEIVGRRGPRRAREERVPHRAPDQGEGLPRRGEPSRHLLGGVDIGAEPFGNRSGLHPPTVVRPLASPCVDAPGPGPPSARSRWPLQPWSAPSAAQRRRRTERRSARAGEAPLVLVSQTPWVTADQPWFNIALAVSSSRGIGQRPAREPDLLRAHQRRLRPAAGDLGHTRAHPRSRRLTGHPRHRRAPAGSPPPSLRDGAAQRERQRTGRPGTASARRLRPPSPSAARRAPTSAGTSTPCPWRSCARAPRPPVARFTTFLTYQQPAAVWATGGPLRVGVVVPVTAGSFTTMADALTDHHDVATTLAVSPLAVSQIEATRSRARAAGTDPAGRADRRPAHRPALRAHQRGRALRGRHLRRNRRSDDVAGDDVLRSAGLKTRWRPLGGHRLDVLAGRRRQPGLRPAAGGGDPGRDQRRRPRLGRGQEPDLRPALHARPRQRHHRLRCRGGLHARAPASPRTRATRFWAPSSCSPGSRSSTSRTRSSAQPRGVVVDPPAGWRPSATFMNALLDRAHGQPGAQAGDPGAALRPGTRRAATTSPPTRQLQAGAAQPRHHADRRRPHRTRPPAAVLVQLRPSTGIPRT